MNLNYISITLVAIFLAAVVLVGFLFVRKSFTTELVSAPSPETQTDIVDNQAAEAVRMYIAAACDWERRALPTDSTLEERLREELKSRMSGNPPSQGLRETMQARAQGLVASARSNANDFQQIAEEYWIGEDWVNETLLICNPPKHDPKHERVIATEFFDDGTAAVTTQVTIDRKEKRRTYRLESWEGKWRIRNYQDSENS